MDKKYSFLSNEPAGKDSFEGKAQERIADIIVEIIGNNNFKVIGIDGGWGTGKSNLVKLIDNKLPNHKFFLYDVWGHQEDEQRKAILIELTEFINEQRIVRNPKDWKDNLSQLLANRKETKTINQPYLSIGFIFSLISIVYTPVVSLFKNEIDKDYLGVNKLIWQGLLVSIPLFLVLFIYLYNLGKYLIKGNYLRSFVLAAQETFQVYTNKQLEETKTETISESQPSVRDFRRWMTKIDEDLGEKKLVLVFDNFDRLPKKQILSIWSVIHVFFAETKYKNIKIIIPFDRLHIKNAFSELNAKDRDYANDYINKTFDIVYRVAPPILSGWKVFLKDNWKKAIPTCSDIEYIKTEQAYEVFRPDITPREILAFINEVVALKMLDNSIPDRYISVFVLNKENIIQDPLKAVTDLTYLKGVEYSYKNDNDFQKYITALAYQIKPENALEVVYKKELKDSLLNEKEERLNEISKTSVFSKILGSTIAEIDNHIKPIYTLSKLNAEAEITAVELQDVWDDIFLQQKSIKAEKWKVEDFQTILLEKISANHKLQWLKQIIDNLYALKSSADGDKDFASVTFSENVDRLNAICSNSNINLDVFTNLLNKNIEVEGFKALVDKKQSDYTKYKLQCSKEKVKAYLKERTFENFNEAKFIFHLDYKYELTEFHELLKTFIPGREGDQVFLNNLYQFLKNTSKQPIVSPLNDAQIHALMNQINIGDPFFVDLACMRIKIGNGSDASYMPVYEKALNSDNQDFYKQVADEIEHYSSLGDILISSIDFQSSLMKGIVPLLIANVNSKNSTLNTGTVVQKLMDISKANGIEAENIFLLLDRYTERAFTYPFVFDLSEEFYREAKKSTSKIAKQIIDVFSTNFRTANNEVWQPAFSNLDSKELNLLQIIEFEEWNSFAIEAFRNKLIEVVGTNSNDNLNKIQPLVELLVKSGKSLDNTFKDVRDKFISTNTITKEHFITFVPLLFKYGSLKDNAANVVRVIFKTGFLDDSGCIGVMLTFQNDLKALFAKCSKTERSDFEDAIKDRTINPKVLELAQTLDIKIAKLKEEDSEQ